jgi:hypothetical protein
MVFKALFGMSDKMGPFGFLVMWFSFFFTTFGVLLADNSVGAPRNFCFASQLVCCTNLISVAYAMINELDFTKVSMLTTPFDMFVTWLSFAFFGGSAVLSSTPIGIFNWIQVVMQALMGLQMMVILLAMARDPVGYKKYLNDKKPVNENP